MRSCLEHLNGGRVLLHVLLEEAAERIRRGLRGVEVLDQSGEGFFRVLKQDGKRLQETAAHKQ